MTRIIFSLLPLLMLIMGVVTFDFWGNTMNMPEDKSGEIRETSLFPARHIRFPSFCNCESEPKWIDYGKAHHPRYLVANKCIDRDCVDYNKCREIQYSFNVSSLKAISDKDYPLSQHRFCNSEWETREHSVVVACIPVPRVYI